MNDEDTETIGIAGAIALCLIAVVLALSGCTATKDAPQTAPINPHEAVSMAVSNCALAIKDIATSPSGDAASKVAAVGAVERLCGQGGGQFAVRQYQTPEPSLGATLWQAALQVADIGARWYGIRAQRDVGINASNNQTAQALGSYGAFSSIASSGFAASTAIAGKIQSPAPNVTTTTTLSGSGVIGSGTYTGPISTVTNPAPIICFPATATSAGTCSR